MLRGVVDFRIITKFYFYSEADPGQSKHIIFVPFILNLEKNLYSMWDYRVVIIPVMSITHVIAASFLALWDIYWEISIMCSCVCPASVWRKSQSDRSEVRSHSSWSHTGAQIIPSQTHFLKYQLSMLTCIGITFPLPVLTNVRWDRSLLTYTIACSPRPQSEVKNIFHFYLYPYSSFSSIFWILGPLLHSSEYTYRFLGEYLIIERAF